MQSRSSKLSKPSLLRRRLIWSLLLIVGLPLLLIGVWYIIVWGRVDFGPQPLVHTIPCKDSGYKLLQYESSKGNGHIDLVDKNGKVYGSAKINEATEIGIPMWDDDCKGVLLGASEGLERLQVPR